ncbi:hypothetical protein CVT26_009451 [Gymnopilus dilepis]|uniref:DUF726-domain-containing protein n=1 Tax=Gymnopilus dilepis TaxID=231916 RepID=A0A409YIC9_9AGAR|nr:hypothetical protein CVT26_009451 [Gymnopilus dilepis]
MPVVSTFPPPKDIFDDDDDDDGWQDMPVVREDTSLSGLDEEDQKKYHYQLPSTSKSTVVNATGNLIDFDDSGNEWRSKLDNKNEMEYTRLRVNEEDEEDEVHLRTKYLFDEDKAMTPLSQMQATKNLLTEAQRIAYVGLCALTTREMVQAMKLAGRKELKASIQNMELWALKIMGRLYYHMELETQEQKMIESLAEHGVLASDLVPALMTTHTVANPEYDPEEARRKAQRQDEGPDRPESPDSVSDQTLVNEPIGEGSQTPTVSSSAPGPSSPTPDNPAHSPNPQPASSTDPHPTTPTAPLTQTRTTHKVLQDTSTAAIPGVSTSLSTTDESVTLDIRWTVLCDLFLILIADSVYDARSRVLLEQVALKLGLGWLDVVKFESRVTQALEIQEDVETLEQKDIVEGARKAGNKRRYVMLGLATLGGGLVIGLSAGLLAPVIGLGLAGALTTVGVTGTGAFLGGTAGAAVITTGGVLTGSGIAVRGMAKRTQQVRTFDVLPLHNNKRVNCILTVPGFMNGQNDDVRLPFSVLDPIVGDVFSVLWEPEMIRETGSALKILTGEVLSQIGMTVLQATVMTGLMTALQWPIILTKLGYLIDNPWSNALDRARAAGRVLADVLIQRHLGVRPITLIGFSLGARVIFYALLELASQKAFGIVQDVFLLGATLTCSTQQWIQTRSVVSGRYVNAFAKNDWVLNYLFRATSGGVGGVAGLRAVEGVVGLENVDVTDKIAGHMSYRTFMPLILDQLGFPVFSDYFDEPEEPDFDEDRIVVREEDTQKKSGWFSSKKKSTSSSGNPQRPVSRPPSTATFAGIQRKKDGEKAQQNGSVNAEPTKAAAAQEEDDDELPPRMETASPHLPVASGSGRNTPTLHSRSASPAPSNGAPNANGNANANGKDPASSIPIHAGFDLNAIKNALKEVEEERGTSVSSTSPAAAYSSAASASASTSTSASNAAPPPPSVVVAPAATATAKNTPSSTPKKSFLSRFTRSPSPAPAAPTRSVSTPPSQAFGAGASSGSAYGYAAESSVHGRANSFDSVGSREDVEEHDLASSSASAAGPSIPAFSRSFSTPLASSAYASASSAATAAASRLSSVADDITSSAAYSSFSSAASSAAERASSSYADFRSSVGASAASLGSNLNSRVQEGLGKSSLSFGNPFGGDEEEEGERTARPGFKMQMPSSLSMSALGLPPEEDIAPAWGLPAAATSAFNSAANQAFNAAANHAFSSAKDRAYASATSSLADAKTTAMEGLGSIGSLGSRYASSIPSPPSLSNPFAGSSAGLELPSLSFGSGSGTGSGSSFTSNLGSRFSSTFNTSPAEAPSSLTFGSAFDDPSPPSRSALSFGAEDGSLHALGGVGRKEEDGWSIPPLTGFGSGSGGEKRRENGGVGRGLDEFGANPWS